MTVEEQSGVAFGLLGAATNGLAACMNFGLGSMFEHNVSPRIVFLLFTSLAVLSTLSGWNIVAKPFAFCKKTLFSDWIDY